MMLTYNYSEQNEVITQLCKLDANGDYVWTCLIDGYVKDYCFGVNNDIFIFSS